MACKQSSCVDFRISVRPRVCVHTDLGSPRFGGTRRYVKILLFRNSVFDFNEKKSGE